MYRARTIEHADLSSTVKEILAQITSQKDGLLTSNVIYDERNLWKHIENFSDDEREKLSNQFDLEKIRYWGFDEKKSGAPDKTASHGRINPSGISYLYTALDEKTAISEIQPMNGALVSVAKIKTVACRAG